jgi:N-acylglucosamine-6-phosphate 2-epimerase
MNIPKGLIVSCQIESDSNFDSDDVTSFALEAIRGGCIGLRIEGSKNVIKVKEKTNIPIIGLTKSVYENGYVYITPSFEDGMELWKSGSDYIAVDATGRRGYNHIKRLYEEGVSLIGDISNFDEAKFAIENGCCCLTTALSGYTEKCEPSAEPDYDLLERLVSSFPEVPILAEGRYWERHQVKSAFNLGAYSVVVGSAITRPHLITERLRGI